MQKPVLTKNVFLFLNELEKNNNREWFPTHKDAFASLEKEVKHFFNGLLEDLRQHDDIEKLKVFRIYRDVRFSKDKTPYKTHFGGSFSRAGAHLRGGYYVHIKPRGSFLATGFWAPNKEDLYRIRKEFESDASMIKEITSKANFREVWGLLQGEEVLTAPKGFDRNHADIDLIRKKQFTFIRNFTDEEVLSEDFRGKVDQSFRAIRPFFDYMSEVLTTNLNGESLLD